MVIAFIFLVIFWLNCLPSAKQSVQEHAHCESSDCSCQMLSKNLEGLGGQNTTCSHLIFLLAC